MTFPYFLSSVFSFVHHRSILSHLTDFSPFTFLSIEKHRESSIMNEGCVPNITKQDHYEDFYQQRNNNYLLAARRQHQQQQRKQPQRFPHRLVIPPSLTLPSGSSDHLKHGSSSSLLIPDDLFQVHPHQHQHQHPVIHDYFHKQLRQRDSFVTVASVSSRSQLLQLQQQLLLHKSTSTAAAAAAAAPTTTSSVGKNTNKKRKNNKRCAAAAAADQSLTSSGSASTSTATRMSDPSSCPSSSKVQKCGDYYEQDDAINSSSGCCSLHRRTLPPAMLFSSSNSSHAQHPAGSSPTQVLRTSSSLPARTTNTMQFLSSIPAVSPSASFVHQQHPHFRPQENCHYRSVTSSASSNHHPTPSSQSSSSSSLSSLSSRRKVMVYNDCIDNYYPATNTDGTASKNNSSKSVPALLDSIRDELHKMTEGTRLGNGNMIHQTNGTTKEIRVIADEDAHPAGGRGEHGDYLQVHNVLGMGTFAQVTCVTIENHQQDPQQQQQQQQRYYACKSVKKELLTKSHTWCNTNGNRRKEYVNVIAQLANEVHVLSNFDHPNIIKLRGVQSHRDWLSTSSVTTSAVSDSHNTNGYRHQQPQQRHQQEGMIYMLTDVLRETLDGRIDRWKQSSRIIDNAKVNHTHNGRRQQLLQSIDKFNVCLQLASALEYVHTKNIVYRDLKPQNIGFDDQGVLQLFDFGLCRELTTSRPKATGIIGTVRLLLPCDVTNQYRTSHIVFRNSPNSLAFLFRRFLFNLVTDALYGPGSVSRTALRCDV